MFPVRIFTQAPTPEKQSIKYSDSRMSHMLCEK